MTRGYPLYLKLEGERCLVFGGGRVATRKVRALIKRGAEVACFSREFTPGLKNLAKRNRRLTLKKMKKEDEQKLLRNGGLPFGPTDRRAVGNLRYTGKDSSAARLAIIATSDRDFNARMAGECRRRKILVNVADEPGLCDFYAVATVERGPLQIAISTGGRSPLFSRRLRETLEKVIPASVGRTLEQIGKIRRRKCSP